MSLPQFTPLPPLSVRLSIAPEEWEACLDAWLTLGDVYLQLSLDAWTSTALKAGHLTQFLSTFYHELARVQPEDGTLTSLRAHALQRTCFKLVVRLAETHKPPLLLVTWDFLSDFCRAHFRSKAASGTVHDLWKRLDAIHNSSKATNQWQTQKDKLARLLESGVSERLEGSLRQIAPMLRVCPDIGAFFMTGSDFLDALATAYSRQSQGACRKAIVSIAYLGLVGLSGTESPNISTLCDHLYSLKGEADQHDAVPSLLNDLVTNTPLVARLRRAESAKAMDRLTALLDQLETYHEPSLAWSKHHSRRRMLKTKGKQSVVGGEMHMHRMSLVTQVQDLFPDLGSGFILRLLGAYNEDVEQLTMHLLEDSLLPHLQLLDRTEQAATFDTDEHSQVDHLAPRSTPPPQPEPFIPERRNVFDNDELDRLEIDTARLHFGKRNALDQTEHQPDKAAILSALAAFDSDDDERDDTYDIEDVGGTVDTAHPDGEPGPSAKATQDENARALFSAYKSSPELFGRTFNVRRGQARQALKAETGMTDEAIEGWAIMLQRDPRRAQRLEAQFSAFDGAQNALAGSTYRESPAGTETEDSDAPPTQRGGFAGRSRGRGGPGRGRGGAGSVAGPSGEASTVAAQRRKEANKGSRANHNRRDQRARKMARGGFGG